MNSIARNIIMNRRRRDSRGDYRSDYGRGNYSISGEYDRRRDRNMDYLRDYNDYDDDYARGDRRDRRGDYAQGVKGTGRYGIGGSRYYGDRMRDGHYDEEEEDFARGRMRDRRDYADESLRLTKSDIRDWKRSLENADGSLGEHFDKTEIENAAEKVGVRYNGYDENELCLTANVLYSDYGSVLKSYIPPEKEAMVYTKLAKAFLEDPDAPEGWEKLAIYYHCIAKDDEE